MSKAAVRTSKGRLVCAVPAKAAIPVSGTVLDVRSLSNPFSAIRAGKLNDSLDAIEEWLLKCPRMNAKLKKLVSDGLKVEGDLYVRCHGGKHRSQVVARLIRREEQDVMASAPRS